MNAAMFEALHGDQPEGVHVEHAQFEDHRADDDQERAHPLGARQMVADRLSITAATRTVRYSPLRISQARLEPVSVTAPVRASSG